MKKVSIIIPSYVADQENCNHLIGCLEALDKNTNRDLYELIIVDNGSNFGVEEMKKVADIYKRYDQPLGYTKAVNIGLRLATTDLLCVLNNDLFVPEKWLETMLEDMEKTGFDAIMPMDTDGEIYKTQAEEGKYYENWVWGALWIIKRKVFDGVGELDETLNWRFSDQDYWIKVKMAGFKLGRTGNVVVKHVLGATYEKMGKLGSFEEQAEAEEMIKRYGVKHFDQWIKQQ